MCRAGGRRCPSHLNELAKNARNAQRRAEYAADKVNSLREQAEDAAQKENFDLQRRLIGEQMKYMIKSQKEQDMARALSKQYLRSVAENAMTAEEFAAASKKEDKEPPRELTEEEKQARNNEIGISLGSLPEIFDGEEYRYTSGEDLFKDTDEVTSSNPDLGVYKTKNTGMLADLRYFNPETIRGKIVKSKLDKDSAHEDFGFPEIPQNDDYELQAFNELKEEGEYAEISEQEVEGLFAAENMAISDFTGEQYFQINGALYATGSKGNAKTNKYVQETVSNIDTAMEKGQKRQRYLYRAMSPWADTLAKVGDVDRWVDRKFSLGEDVVFDGYQSSSADRSGFKSFADEGGVLFEILTPEGLNVTASSSNPEECETLLPRGARYKVVGINKNVDIKFPGAQYGSTYADNTVIRLVAVNSKGEVLDGTNADEVPPLEIDDAKST